MKAELDKLMHTVASVGEESKTTSGSARAPSASRPTIDDERLNRSPGMTNNFYDSSTADFKQPFSVGAPAPGAPVAAAAGTSAHPAISRKAPPTDRGLYAVGEETPMPGREKEYAEYQRQLEEYQQSQPAGEANVAPARAPTIDDERRNKSPGMVKNFYDLDTADFKRPYGMPAGAPMAAGPPQAQPQPVAAAQTSAPPPFARAPAAPPIDEDRRNRSPGMVKNFYDTSTADFKRPHGMPAGAPAPQYAPEAQAPPANQAAAADDGLGGRLYAVGEETPMPGREREYNEYKQQYHPVSTESASAPVMSAPVAARAPAGPPIDEERRNRSPGMVTNFYDTSTADFKRPHGMLAGAPAPPSTPQASVADDAGAQAGAYAKANAEAAAKAKADAEAVIKARTDAAIKAKADAAAGAYAAAYLAEQKEIEAKAKAQAEVKAKAKAEADKQKAIEAKAKAEVEAAERKKAEAKAEAAKQKEIEAKAKLAEAKVEIEAKAKALAKARAEQKEIEAKAKAKAEEAEQKEIEARAKAKAAAKIDADRATKVREQSQD